MKVVIQVVLWLIIGFLGYKVYDSVSGPVRFNKIKEERYRAVIKNLKDIRTAQLAHQEITGNFAGTYDSLIQFIDTAQFAITVRRDTSYADVEKNRAFGLDEGYYIEDIVVDTIGYAAVKDSLFGSTDRYKTMMNVPVEGLDAKFELQSGKQEKNEIEYSVFMARVAKSVILSDQPEDLVLQENAAKSVEEVNGRFIQVGSMDKIDTSGNWPKLYDTNEENQQ